MSGNHVIDQTIGFTVVLNGKEHNFQSREDGNAWIEAQGMKTSDFYAVSARWKTEVPPPPSKPVPPPARIISP